MKVVVILAGVLDPKWPIDLDGNGLPQVLADRMIMSPFDESALEVALRLREMEASCSVSTIVTGEKIARSVAAFRIEDIAILSLDFHSAIDSNQIAAALAAAVPPDADLVLIGREFGDCDDGAVPPLLATRLRWPFFGRLQEVRSGGVLVREVGTQEEIVKLTRPILCSVTNDRRNRLRKPLMKNVMAARGAEFRAIFPPGGKPVLRQLACVADVRRPIECRLMNGAPAEMATILAREIRLSVDT